MEKLILCIETGTDICSAALAKNGEMISLRESAEGRDHARKIAVFVDEMLKSNSIEPDEIDAMAVGKGPGSYTGLRIGVSFAKGLCYGLHKPLLAVDSLESLARCVDEDYRSGVLDADDWEHTLLCPMIDARRMEVYMELFDHNMHSVSEVSAQVIDGHNLDAFLDGGRQILVFGSGAAKAAEAFEGRNVRLVDAQPSARGLCMAAQRRLDEGLIEDTAYFEPFYLKDFVVTKSNKKLF